jgi:hypothetical protein|tara:strand:- start:84 stop:344 length:261 start_codon:yes stop_codon:yes gene_type:complete
MGLPSTIEYSFVSKTESYLAEGDFTGKHEVTISTECIPNGKSEIAEKLYTDFVATIEDGSNEQYATTLFNNLEPVICTAYGYPDES